MTPPPKFEEPASSDTNVSVPESTWSRRFSWSPRGRPFVRNTMGQTLLLYIRVSLIQ